MSRKRPSRVSLTQHATFDHFTLGDLEDFVKKARKDLGRDCVLHFPLDTRLYSDSHGEAGAMKLTCETSRGDFTDTDEAYIDIDFG